MRDAWRGIELGLAILGASAIACTLLFGVLGWRYVRRRPLRATSRGGKQRPVP